MRLRSVRPILLASLLALGTASAQEGATPPDDAGTAAAAEVPAEVGAPSTGPSPARQDLEAWLDGFMPLALDTGDIAGAVVVVVKDGEVLLQKGYGYRDLAAGAPVDPEDTLFRPGSVSKLFTWTAVMQLVEKGQLDLDADVNQYVDFTLPERDGKPVTLRQIMTHTTGMEEQIRGLIGSDASQLVPLGDALKRWVPERIHVPGSTPAYSNYATALAGYIVERVSGQSFDDYVEQHILHPLGMRQSSFRQPLQPELLAKMSQGYASASDAQPKPYELINLAPAGSLAATGADMARFMLAHLGKGAHGDARILSEATAEAMHRTGQATVGPLNQMMLGFYETSVNGRRAIAHGGDTQWFHSDLQLFPDDGVGVFVSFNSSGRPGSTLQLRTALMRAIADRYLPGPHPEGPGVDEAMAKEMAAKIAGSYDSSRRPGSNFMALANLLGRTTVVANPDGTISVPAMVDAGGAPKKWRAIGPWLWQYVDGGDRIAAEVVDGKVVRFGIEPYAAIMVFERRSAATLPLLVAGLLVVLLTVLAWPVSALVRRHYRVPYRLSGEAARAHRIARLSALASLVAIAAGFGLVIVLLGDLERLSPAMDALVISIRILAGIALPLAALGALWSAWKTLRGPRPWLAKAWNLLLAASCVYLLWIGVAFHLVGASANY